MFDKDKDGFLKVSELKRMMSSLGDDKLGKKDLEKMLKDADKCNGGLVNWEGRTKLMTYDMVL